MLVQRSAFTIKPLEASQGSTFHPRAGPRLVIRVPPGRSLAIFPSNFYFTLDQGINRRVHSRGYASFGCIVDRGWDSERTGLEEYGALRQLLVPIVWKIPLKAMYGEHQCLNQGPSF